MARKLILITYDGGPSNFLPGIEKDRRAYLDYFKSRTGGAYSPSEITEFHNDPMLTVPFLDTTIKACIEHQKVDQLTIVFCGHGYDSSNGNTYMEMSSNLTCSVLHLSQVCQGTETLLIADCCRNVCVQTIKPLMITNPFFNIARATEHGSFALEDKDGGLYSQNLVKAGHCKQLPAPRAFYSISQVHRLASIWVYFNSDKNQHPEILGSRISSIIFSHK